MCGAYLHVITLNGSAPRATLVQPPPLMGTGKLPVVHSLKEPESAGPHEQLWWEGGQL